MKANGQYTIAIHICIFMSYHREDLYSSTYLSESVHTNPVVIRRLVSKLREAGIVGSVAGSVGGFYLTRPASKITLWEIYLAVNEKAQFYQPKPNPTCVVSRNLSYLLSQPYADAELSMKKVLHKTTIKVLTEKLRAIPNP